MKNFLSEIFEKIQKEPKKRQIELFCKEFENSPKQGTEKWLSERKIGGSDAYKALNDPKFIEKKNKKIKKNLVMEWGNLLEPVVISYLRKNFEIFTTNSVPGFGIDDKIYTTFSPDGIFYGDALGLSGINLLEIKCPAIRAPTGNVPEIYKPQIQLGLSTLLFCEKCLYIECYAKICSLTNFCFNKRSTGFSKYIITDPPIAIGFVSFSGNFDYKEPLDLCFPESISFIPQSTKNLCGKKINFNGIDFGAAGSLFYKTGVLETYDHEKKYSELLFEGDPKEFFEKEFERLGGDGVLCYKIFEFKTFIIEKEDYTENIKKLVEIGKKIYG